MQSFVRVRLFCLLVFVVFVSSCHNMPGGSAGGKNVCDSQEHRFTIVNTNDNHGHFWRNFRGEGGMAARKTLIDSIRRDVENKGGSVLVLSGGDINTGVPSSDMLDAMPDIKGMNMIGYDASAVGNHEFDNPLPVLMKQARWASFPFLAANIYDKATGKRLFQPYVVVDAGGLKVAILGLSTLDTVQTSNPDVTKKLKFTDPIKEAKALMPEMRSKADVVVAATHLGWYFRGNYGVNAPGDVNLARKVDGIDIIAGGHSQDPLFRPDIINSTYIMQAFEWGKYVGRADFVYRDGLLKMTDYQLIPVNLKKKVTRDGKTAYINIGQTIAEDKAMLELLKPYKEKGDDLLNVVVGQVDKRLMGERAEVRFHETALGRLIAEAQRQRTNADLAVLNSGGIRASIQPGQITYRDVLSVQPFGNQVSFIDITGKKLKNYLQVVGSMPPDSGAFAHFANVAMVVEDGVLKQVTIGGRRVIDDKKYRLAVNSFSASGGDGYPLLSDKSGFVNTGYVDAEVLKDFIQKHSPIKVNDYQPTNEVRRD